MRTPLEETMPWNELCEYVFNKIKHNLKEKERPTFKKWFMEREEVGYLFDAVMVRRCFRIWQDLKNGLDHFIVLSGREGYGKSTFSFQIAAWCTPNFSLNNVCYGAKTYLDILSKKAEEYEKDKTKEIENESVILDEGTELLSRETLNVTNRSLVKTFFVQRTLGFLVIVNIPNFFMLDTVIRNHRVRTLIEVIARGKYKCITGKGIKKVAKEGKDTKDINGVRLKAGTWWTGDFRKAFPKAIDRKEYEQHKIISIKELLELLKDDVVHRKMIAASKVAKEIGSSPETITSMIKRGEVEGKMIGGKYYLTRKAYDKLITPNP